MDHLAWELFSQSPALCIDFTQGQKGRLNILIVWCLSEKNIPPERTSVPTPNPREEGDSGPRLGPGDHRYTWWVRQRRAHPWRGKRKWSFYEILYTYSFIKLLFHPPPKFNHPSWERSYVCFHENFFCVCWFPGTRWWQQSYKILNSVGFTFLGLSKYVSPSRPVLSLTSRKPPYNHRPVCLVRKVKSSRTCLCTSPWHLIVKVLSFSSFSYG